MKRNLFIVTILAVSFLTPSARAAGRSLKPYEPAPQASYPATPQIDASKPAIELAPVRHREIDQTPEEAPGDPVEDSKTPAGPSLEESQEAPQPSDPATVPTGPEGQVATAPEAKTKPESGVPAPTGEAGTDDQVTPPVAEAPREEAREGVHGKVPVETIAQGGEIAGKRQMRSQEIGGCSLVR